MSSLSFGRLGGASRIGKRHLLTLMLFALLVLISHIAPRISAGPLYILGLFALVSLNFQITPPVNLLKSDRLALVLLVFSAYLFINASWSLDLKQAYWKAGYFIVVLIILHVTLQWISEAKSEERQTVLSGVTIGAAMACAYLLIELLTEQSLKRWAYTLLPVIAPSGGEHVTITNGEVSSVGIYLLNRSIAKLMLLFWPFALVLSARLSAMRLKLALAALATVWASVALTSEHQTSAIALLLSFAVFLVYRAWPRFGRWTITVVWCVSVLFVVPAAFIAHQAGLHQAKWLPANGRARIILWDVTAQNVLRNPILGIGIRSTRVLDAQNPNKDILPDGQAYPMRTGRHAHNMYLQTWYELGAVGAVLLLIIGLLVFRGLSRLPAQLQPYAFSACTLICTIAAFSFGMWQSWYVSSLATAAIFLVLALRDAGEGLHHDARDPGHHDQTVQKSV